MGTGNAAVMRVITLILILAGLFSPTLQAQVVNGDFSMSLTDWTVVLPPGNHLTPDHGLMTLDIDGPGPFSNSTPFYAAVGNDALLNLQQSVSLSSGVTYQFVAYLASTSTGNNADGGTVAAFLGATQVSAFSFGSVAMNVTNYGILSGIYTAQATGSQTLSINFSRSFGFGGPGQNTTPTDYIDLISLTAIPEPSSLPLVIAGALLLWPILKRKPSA
jgi:hypothetical protein